MWAMIATLSVSHGMPMALTWRCLAAGVALFLILGGARSIAQGRPAGGSAALYLLLYLCMQGWLCTTAPGRDILRDTWQLLPAMMVVAAEGIGGGVSAAAQWAGGRRIRIWRYAALTFVWAAVLAGGALWLRMHAHSVVAAMCDMADQDVAAPATFLRLTAPHDALLTVQLAGDVRVLPQTRYTLAPLLASRPAACIVDVAPGATPVMPAPARPYGWWHIGAVATDVLARLTQTSGGTNVTAPFVIPVTYVSGSNAWTAGDSVRVLRRAAAAAPLSRAVYVALLAWYRQSNAGDVQAALASGDAMDDLAPRLVSACAPDEYRAALNSIVYAWSAPDQVRARQGAYALFHRFVTGVDRHALDRERVAYIYRLYLAQALAASNSVAARAILQDARAWDARDPYYDRLEAGVVSLEQPTAYARMRALNKRAARRHVQRHGRPFFDALFANVLLAKAEGAAAQALQQCYAMLALLQADARADQVATTAGAAALKAKARRDADRLFWEAQCNSYIALLMMAMGDYANAIVWQTKNLDERFDAVRHRVSYERLASLYLALGDVTRALRKYEELAAVSTTAYERLYWMLQATQINVTYGDAVAVFDQWAAIERMLEQLGNEDRHRWTRDKQLQRVLRYVQRRLNVDVRDVAETMLLRNIAKAEDAAWRYRQVAQLQRCRLQYDRAAATYAQALALTQAEDAVYLDAAMLAYQRQQYARAIALVSNLCARATSPCASALTSDWRYTLLALLQQHGKPPGMDDLLRWVDHARPAFAATASWHNARGNIHALYGNFTAATNEFTLGIAAQPDAVENHLDLGYLYCTRADAEETGRILDRLAALYPSNAVPRRILQDWRTIELYHVSIRPYVVE
jgi:tetratricopeptide (TPR) repeat protein